MKVVRKMIMKFHKEEKAQAIVEYVLVVTAMIFGTLVVVNGIDLPFEINGDIVRIKGFKDAINAFLKQIYILLYVLIP